MTDVDRFRIPEPPTREALHLPLASLAWLCTANLLAVIAAAALVSSARPALTHGAILSVALVCAGATLIMALLRLTGTWSFPHRRLGACNGITGLRGSLACLLVTPLAAPEMLQDPAVAWTVFAVGLVALSLDGIDGWFARRQGTASAFGARFDLEIDAFLALVLAALAWTGGAAGPAVIVLGTARYVFWGARFAVRWMRHPLPERLSRKAVCVVQLGVLIAVQAPIMPDMLGEGLVIVAATLLLWSFGRDTVWLARRAA